MHGHMNVKFITYLLLLIDHILKVASFSLS
jgi:hypothetical protein